jgi:serine/threonine-protein kinase
LAQGLPDRSVLAGVAIHPAAGQALRFGPFRFDRANRVLARDGLELPLPPRALGVLEHLLERPGSIVSKSALLEAVWPDTAVTETSLTEAVSLVRQALGDDPQQPAYVQTVHRRGYRFVGPVEVESPTGRAVPLPSVDEAVAVAARPRLRAALSWAVAVLAVALAGAVYATRPAPARRHPMRFTIPMPAAAPLLAKSPAALALSPDGRVLAYTAGRGEKSQLYLRPLDRFEAMPVAGTAGAEAPFFSPDGRWVGFFAEGRLRKVPVGGGTAVDIAEANHLFGASWGDGDAIVFAPTYRGGLMRVAADGGTPAALTRLDVDAGELAHVGPEVLPGGDTVVFTILTSGGLGQARLAAAEVRSGRRLDLKEPGTFARYSPSGHLVFGRADGVAVAPFDARGVRLTGAARLVLAGVATSAQIGMPHLALSREGTLAYVPGDGRLPLTTLAWEGAAGEPRAWPTAARPFMNADLAPGGRHAAVTIHEPMRSDVWLADAERGALTRLTFEGHNIEPVFTPDGRSVTYASGGRGPANVFWVPADGSGAPARLLASPLNQYPSSWSADGRVLVYTELHPETGADLWALTRGEARGRPLLRSKFDEDRGELSPDGRWLAYESNESNRWEVYVRPWPALSPRWQVSTDGGYAPLWSADGRTIFYDSGDQTLLGVDITAAPEFQASRPRVVARDPQAAWYGVDSEGRLLAIRQPGGSPPGPIHVVVGWAAELSSPPDAP